MESLIFSLTPKQYKKYLEILNADKIGFDFDFSMPDIAQYPFKDVKVLINGLNHEASRIATFKKNGLFFSELDKNEVAKLIPIYFEVIDKINKTGEALCLEISKISRIISKIELAISDLNLKYTEFLPYKAAFLEKAEYSAKITELENSFKENLKWLDEQKEEECRKLSSLSKICELHIPELMQSSAKAAGSPSFKNFKQKEFFLVFDAFITRINNI